MSVPSQTAHPPCPRCHSEDEVVRPWAGFGVVYLAWKAGVIVLAVFSPIIASDLVVMMPLSMAFLFAGGPVIAFAEQQPTCRSCGLARPHPGWHETLFFARARKHRALERRAVRALGVVPGPSLHGSPSRPASESERERADEDSGVRSLPLDGRRSRPPAD